MEKGERERQAALRAAEGAARASSVPTGRKAAPSEPNLKEEWLTVDLVAGSEPRTEGRSRSIARSGSTSTFLPYTSVPSRRLCAATEPKSAERSDAYALSQRSARPFRPAACNAARCLLSARAVALVGCSRWTRGGGVITRNGRRFWSCGFEGCLRPSGAPARVSPKLRFLRGGSAPRRNRSQRRAATLMPCRTGRRARFVQPSATRPSASVLLRAP